ncbi:hypothetical protein M422DRAFT_255559, partial [Sphaerobolus stellatus SS14]
MSHRKLDSDGLWDIVRFPRPCPPPPQCSHGWPRPPQASLGSTISSPPPPLLAPCRRRLQAPPLAISRSQCHPTPLRTDPATERHWEAPEPPSVALVCLCHHLHSMRCVAVLCAPRRTPSYRPSTTPPLSADPALERRWEAPRASQRCSCVSLPPPPLHALRRRLLHARPLTALAPPRSRATLGGSSASPLAPLCPRHLLRLLRCTTTLCYHSLRCTSALCAPRLPLRTLLLASFA